MAASQMNIRMESSLKGAGNAALEQLGFTPSQVVRAVWEYVAVQGSLPSPIMRILQGQGADAGASPASGEDARIDGSQIVSAFYQRTGIPEPTQGSVDYEKLRELAAVEQLEGWGLS